MLRLFEIIAAGFILLPAAWLAVHLEDASIQRDLLLSAIAGVACCALTSWLIPTASSYLLRRGLKGIDLGKKGSAAGRVDM